MCAVEIPRDGYDADGEEFHETSCTELQFVSNNKVTLLSSDTIVGHAGEAQVCWRSAKAVSNCQLQLYCMDAGNTADLSSLNILLVDLDLKLSRGLLKILNMEGDGIDGTIDRRAGARKWHDILNQPEPVFQV